MKQFLLWFLLRRWYVIRRAKNLGPNTRASLLGAMTTNRMIPASGLIAADAAMILLFDDDEPAFNREDFMLGWRCARDIIDWSIDKSRACSMVIKVSMNEENNGLTASYRMGAKLAAEQIQNLMASHRQ